MRQIGASRVVIEVCESFIFYRALSHTEKVIESLSSNVSEGNVRLEHLGAGDSV